MDRASALETAFLRAEDAHSFLHIGSVALFVGPTPPLHEIRTAIARRLPSAPRLRQRLLAVPFELGRPVWADDPGFDLDRHLRRVALPAPGGEDQLHEAVDAIFSEPLDHDLPLWEAVVLEGLTGDRWALVTKVHHTMADGIAGTDLLSTMLDPVADPPPGAPPDPWSPAPPPGLLRLVGDAVRDQAALRIRELRAAPRLAQAVLHPRRTAADAVRFGRGLVSFAPAVVPTEPSSLVGPLGRDRTYRWTEVELDDVLRAHAHLDGTVNDLVLTVVSGAFRELLITRGEDPSTHTVRCLVPVSVRTEHERGHLDNRVSALLVELPVELADVRQRLEAVVVRMRALKASGEADAGSRLTLLADALPPAALAGFLRLVFRTPQRSVTTVTTNVPGPTRPLFLAGRALLRTYPYVPIADRVRIGVAVTTYADQVLFGITCDRDSTPDVRVFVDALDAALAELVELGQESTGAADRSPARSSIPSRTQAT